MMINRPVAMAIKPRKAGTSRGMLLLNGMYYNRADGCCQMRLSKVNCGSAVSVQPLVFSLTAGC
jgi:hypothetical protein